VCLGIPGQVVELVDGTADQLAMVDVDGARRRVNVGMLDHPPGPGDWVVVHLGFAMESVDEEEARAMMPGPELVGPPPESVGHGDA
jgi:hydrogenase maturation protein HypF